MATIDIGKIKPVFKGTYDNSTAYVLDDIVYYNGSSYVAKTSTTGNLPTDATKWNVLASGIGGIYDSTLSLGSANQQLRVNSGATALEFYTPSVATSDFVKLASGAPTLYYYCQYHSGMGGQANTPVPANNTLQVITTNQGADNISNTQFNSFTDTLFSASGFTFSIDGTSGNLIATI